MNLADWLRAVKDPERQRVAKAAGTTVEYLYVVAGGHRRPSPKLARKLAEATANTPKKITKAKLRPDIWGQGAAA